MSTIFSHAVNAIKSTSDTRVTKPSTTLTKKEIYSREEESKDPKSILNRIQLNKKVGKPVKSITLRKNSEDDDRSFGIDNIQRKIIKKEPITLKRPSKKSDMEGAWKHDLYDGPTVSNPSNMHCTVFVRNLPEGINSQYLRDILQDDEFVVGIRLDNGTAEVNFSKKDAAQRAADELNGKMLKGRKIKAAVMGDINTGVAGKTSRQSSRVDETKEDNDRSFTKTKMHADDQDDRKPSILSRIKKTH